MTYLVRGILIALGMFFLSYATLSLLVCAFWRVWSRRGLGWSANAMFTLRLLPLAAAMGTVAILVVPSFLRLEPRQAEESMALAGVLFADSGAAVLVFGLVSALAAWCNSARYLRRQAAVGSTTIEPGIPVIEIEAPAPVLLVAGVRRPRILLSRDVRELLTPGEFRAAIGHELAHLKSHDNLKKLVLRLCAFPGMAALERAWTQQLELVADDAVAQDERAALDLASALLKMARHSRPAPIPHLALGLLSASDGSLRLRVRRLLAWHRRTQPRHDFAWLIGALVPCLTALVLAYAPLLRGVHEITELLVR